VGSAHRFRPGEVSRLAGRARPTSFKKTACNPLRSWPGDYPESGLWIAAPDVGWMIRKGQLSLPSI